MKNMFWYGLLVGGLMGGGVAMMTSKKKLPHFKFNYSNILKGKKGKNGETEIAKDTQNMEYTVQGNETNNLDHETGEEFASNMNLNFSEKIKELEEALNQLKNN